MRERGAPCKRPYRCAASRRKMCEGDAGLSWALVHETIKLMLAKLEPSIVRKIREDRIGDAHVHTDEALIEAARCNVGMYVPTPKPMGKHTLRVLVLAYMHPELRPEVVRRWGPLSFFATSSVKSLSDLFSAPAGVRAVRMQGTYETGSGIESLLARATREDVAEASKRLPLFCGTSCGTRGKCGACARSRAPSSVVASAIGMCRASRRAAHVGLLLLLRRSLRLTFSGCSSSGPASAV